MNTTYTYATIAVLTGLVTVFTDLPAFAQFGLGILAITCGGYALYLSLTNWKESR